MIDFRSIKKFLTNRQLIRTSLTKYVIYDSVFFLWFCQVFGSLPFQAGVSNFSNSRRLDRTVVRIKKVN